MSSLLSAGGWVLTAILALSFVAWILIGWEWLRTKPSAHDAKRGRSDWPELDPLVALAERGPRERVDRREFRTIALPLLDSLAVRAEAPLNTIAVIGTSLPLLGLLGTVLGMTTTFSAVAERRELVVEAIAGGTGQALITTQAGLIFALPILVAHGYLTARTRRATAAAELLVRRLESHLSVDDAERS